ncbi:helix-turn-helix domain-containing protein [Mangrovibacterium lignilyticum]|uniref:helix-turn-helix domain-containing protein n=1 Tax=Mangrovibacterium lignilyticum TaxID=2668052 RepID=UPI0013D36EEE|nr:AraC family transcriptional regulator [Mangrovibacterium lignilyticum]
MIENLAFKIFKSKYFVGPIATVSLFFAAIAVYFSLIPDQTIFPNSDLYNYDSYTDESDGGKSQIERFSVTDSLLCLKFRLNEGFFSPYAGLSITPKTSHCIEAKRYNQISVQMRGIRIDRVGIALYNPPLSDQKNKTQDETLYHSYLSISDQPETYHIPFGQLKHPEWWEDLHQMTETNNDQIDLTEILHLNIGSAFSPDIDELKTLEIYSVAFTRNNRRLYTTLTFAYLALVSLIYGSLYAVMSGKHKTTRILVSYQPVETTEEKTSDEKCMAYINRNFHNSELNLDLVAKETGIPQRRITNAINAGFNCNFKTYINRIRINEAKRLLAESDLNIGEIAYKVGFNSQSHFNRVFKSELDTSPSAYRTNKQA